MKQTIAELPESKAKDILVDIMSVYFDKGFGIMNKTEIEILLFHVLKKHEILKGKCFEDSLKLKISEAKARKLIYESQVKYTPYNENELYSYLRTSVGECLKNAYFAKNNKEIRFAIEDKFLRVALNAKLRQNNYFTDTSFNKDIVSLDENAFKTMVALLVPNTSKNQVLEKFTAIELDEETKRRTLGEIVKKYAKEAFVNVSIDAIKEIAFLLLI